MHTFQIKVPAKHRIVPCDICDKPFTRMNLKNCSYCERLVCAMCSDFTKEEMKLSIHNIPAGALICFLCLEGAHHRNTQCVENVEEESVMSEVLESEDVQGVQVSPGPSEASGSRRRETRRFMLRRCHRKLTPGRRLSERAEDLPRYPQQAGPSSQYAEQLSQGVEQPGYQGIPMNIDDDLL